MKNLVLFLLSASFVKPALASINFSPNRNIEVCGASTVYFVYNNAIIPHLIKWDFGDGETATQASVSHHYSKPGKYTVTLFIETNGKWDSIKKVDLVTILEIPVAQPIIEKPIILSDKSYTFINRIPREHEQTHLSQWTVNNDVFSKHIHTHQFTDSGQQVVKLKYSAPNGCSVDTNLYVKIPGNHVTIHSGMLQQSTIPIQMYPNPATDYLVLTSEKQIQLITITNNNGQQIPVNTVQSPATTTVDVSSLTPGLYVISATLISGELITKKIVIE